jgi:hypothetical protein
MTRLQDLIQKTRENLQTQLCVRWCEDSDLLAAITNGDIDLPHWLSFSEDGDCVKFWDNEEYQLRHINKEM